MIAVRLLAEGAVVREAVFRAGSLTIGRGAGCDFVLLDASVSREHARVRCDETGAAWIEDAGSRNGLRVAGCRVERVDLVAGTPLRCQLGAVELEVALASPADTQEIVPPEPPARATPRALRAIGLWAAALGAAVVNQLFDPAFWSPWNQERLSTLAQASVGIALAVPILAFLLLGLLRVVHRKARVGDALRALAIMCWAWVALELLLRVAAYLLPVSGHDLLASFTSSAAGALTVAYMATTARGGPNRRFFVAWLGAMALVVLAFAGAARLSTQQTGAPQVDHELQAPIAGFSGPATDLDGYLAGLRSDYAVAERAAADERRSSAARR